MENVADRKSVRKIFGLSRCFPRTHRMLKIKKVLHIRANRRLSVRSTCSVNIPSSPGGGDSGRDRETGGVTDVQYGTPSTSSGPSFGVGTFEERVKTLMYLQSSSPGGSWENDIRGPDQPRRVLELTL